MDMPHAGKGKRHVLCPRWAFRGSLSTWYKPWSKRVQRAWQTSHLHRVLKIRYLADSWPFPRICPQHSPAGSLSHGSRHAMLPLLPAPAIPWEPMKTSTFKWGWTKPVPTSCNSHSSSCSGSTLTYYLGSLYLLWCSCAPPFTQAPYLSVFPVGLHPFSHHRASPTQAPQHCHNRNFSGTILAFLMLFYIYGGITFAARG